MKQAQQFLEEWVANHYPDELKSEIKGIEIGFQGLESNLDLGEFPNLEVLYCQFNYLTSIDLSKNNKLISLTYDGEEKEEMEELEKEITGQQAAIEKRKNELILNNEERELLKEFIEKTIKLDELTKEKIVLPDYGEKAAECRKSLRNVEKELKKIINDEDRMEEVYTIQDDYEQLFSKQLKLKKKER